MVNVNIIFSYSYFNINKKPTDQQQKKREYTPYSRMNSLSPLYMDFFVCIILSKICPAKGKVLCCTEHKRSLSHYLVNKYESFPHIWS